MKVLDPGIIWAGDAVASSHLA